MSSEGVLQCDLQAAEARHRQRARDAERDADRLLRHGRRRRGRLGRRGGARLAVDGDDDADGHGDDRGDLCSRREGRLTSRVRTAEWPIARAAGGRSKIGYLAAAVRLAEAGGADEEREDEV